MLLPRQQRPSAAALTNEQFLQTLCSPPSHCTSDTQHTAPFIISTHCSLRVPSHSTTMSTNEVNEIVVKLLAAADRVTGREQREDILHYVGRLSRAATRERTAAVDEMQNLRKRIVQQSSELRRLREVGKALQTPSAAPPPQAPQPALVRLPCVQHRWMKRALTFCNRPVDLVTSVRLVSR